MIYNFIKGLIRKKRILSILISLTLASFCCLYAAQIQCVWTGVEKIVAVGDLHGDYENFVEILKGTGLVDENLHWTGSKTHLVQIGDVVDRGPEAWRIFDLLMTLEKEAEMVGGKIHPLLGNHEEMNITGIALDYRGYVNVDQFVSFLPEKYRENQERKFIKKMGSRSPGRGSPASPIDSDLREYWEEFFRDVEANENHPARKKYYEGFNEKYGKWLLEHNAVIKINDIVFVHGGVSERFSEWKIEDINDRLRLELGKLSQGISIERRITYVSDGPLWYRMVRDEGLLKEDVDRILLKFNAQCMVTAHTPQTIIDKAHMNRFDGRLWIIDTGISKAYGGHLSALIIEDYGKKFLLWPEDFTQKNMHLLFMGGVP
jgi:hypothetical protein